MITQPASNRKRASGQSMVEYALIGALVIVTCITAAQYMGWEITRIFNDSAGTISTKVGGAVSSIP
ncbi:MAG: Flp family type IVb pilin [Candidatus Melainabacteria bacterium]